MVYCGKRGRPPTLFLPLHSLRALHFPTVFTSAHVNRGKLFSFSSSLSQRKGINMAMYEGWSWWQVGSRHTGNLCSSWTSGPPQPGRCLELRPHFPFWAAPCSPTFHSPAPPQLSHLSERMKSVYQRVWHVLLGAVEPSFCLDFTQAACLSFALLCFSTQMCHLHLSRNISCLVCLLLKAWWKQSPVPRESLP